MIGKKDETRDFPVCGKNRGEIPRLDIDSTDTIMSVDTTCQTDGDEVEN